MQRAIDLALIRLPEVPDRISSSTGISYQAKRVGFCSQTIF